MVDFKKVLKREQSPYAKHKAKWENCERCHLCQSRQKVVPARGRIPCDVLFIGEAPGASEDVIGLPFVGPAGHLLDQIIERGLDGQYEYCITNLVGCIPLDSEGDKTQEPDKKAIDACSPRLKEMIEMCKPKLIVRVGKLATKYARINTTAGVVDIIHPAAILRMEPAQRGLAVQRCVVTIEDAVVEI